MADKINWGKCDCGGYYDQDKYDQCSKCAKEKYQSKQEKTNVEQSSQEFNKAKDFKPDYEGEKARLMILSYTKDLICAGKLDFYNMSDFMFEAEKYIKTGQFDLIKEAKK